MRPVPPRRRSGPRSGSTSTVVALAALVGICLGSPRVASCGVCDVDEICAPTEDPCPITSRVEVGPCELDFGSRRVVVSANVVSETEGGSFSIVAGSLVLLNRQLRAPGGGSISVRVEGPFRTSGRNAGVDVDGLEGGGSFTLTAGSVEHTAGSITARSGGSVDDGGDITLVSHGLIYLGSNVEATGGDQGSGGFIEISQLVGANSDVTVASVVDASGGESDGGDVSIDVESDLILTKEARIHADGRSTGDGGEVNLTAGGSIELRGGSVTAAGGLAGGGAVTLEAGEHIDLDGTLSVEGGATDFGGSIDLVAERDIIVRARARVSAAAGSQGGDISSSSAGTLMIGEGATFTVSGNGPLSAEPWGGSIALDEHCAIDVLGKLDANGKSTGKAGDISAVAVSITVGANAEILARPCLQVPSCNGLEILESNLLAVAQGAIIDPAPEVTTTPSLTSCCGNGIEDSQAGETCDDGNRLHCDGCSSGCSIESTPRCDPGNNPCVEIRCDPVLACVQQPRTGAPCPDDGDVCTIDRCSGSGRCIHFPKVCAEDGNVCTRESCQVDRGCISVPVDSLCDDGNECTRDVCDPNAGCIPINDDGAPCDDGDPCSRLDTCLGGACTGLGSPLDCDDGDPCTLDSCIGEIGCHHRENPMACPCEASGIPKPVGTHCVDGDECTYGEVCDGAGACFVPFVRSCDDDDHCTVDLCDPELGCVHVEDAVRCRADDCVILPDGSPCNDGSLCTDSACFQGQCVDLGAVECGAQDPCEGAAYCSILSGCASTSAPHPGCPRCSSDLECEDDDPCTVSRCDPLSGCVATTVVGCSDVDGDGRADGTDACITLAHEEPPRFPPDQNPAGLSVKLFRSPNGRNWRRLKARGHFQPATTQPPIDPRTHGVFVQLTDQGGSFYGVSVPGAAPDDPSASPCDRRDGWSVKSNDGTPVAWRYQNRSGALPPGCEPGSAKGIRRFSLRYDDGPLRGPSYHFGVHAKVPRLDRAPERPLERFELLVALGAKASDGNVSVQSRAGQCTEFATEVHAGSSGHCRTESDRAGDVALIECRSHP